MQVLLAVFGFLSALRFRKDIPLNQVITRRYGRQVVLAYRQLQKTRLRGDKSALDLQFLTTCKCGGIIPKFLYFKVSLQNFTNTKLYKSILFQCLDFEIKRKEKLVTHLKGQYVRELGQFRNLVTWLDFKILVSKLTKGVGFKLGKIRDTHTKKLHNLGLSSQGGIGASKVIFNFSNRVLTKVEEDVLQLGLQFGLPDAKPRFVDHFLAFERFISNLTYNRRQFVGSEQSWTGLINGIKSVANESFTHKPSTNSSVDKHRISVLKGLKDDKNIVICKPDKGNGVVILNKDDYISKTEEILQDITKFKLLKEDWFKCILRLEDKLNRLLRAIKTKLTDEVYGWLYASGSTPGVLYGLPKVHKDGCPIRPILSAIGTFNYNLAKFFVPVLAPLTTNEYTLANSIQFVKDVLSVKFPHQFFYGQFRCKVSVYQYSIK